eukprot:7809088-Alexandrium_andersonii.AAC.2
MIFIPDSRQDGQPEIASTSLEPGLAQTCAAPHDSSVEHMCHFKGYFALRRGFCLALFRVARLPNSPLRPKLPLQQHCFVAPVVSGSWSMRQVRFQSDVRDM